MHTHMIIHTHIIYVCIYIQCVTMHWQKHNVLGSCVTENLATHVNI